MKLDCRNFRAALELALAGEERSLSALTWHEHLAACHECRALLDAEEALELLLASLPEPRLPRRLAQRVLVRLRAARHADVQLDELLTRAGEVAVPGGLAARVLASLALARAAGSAAHGATANVDAAHVDAAHVDEGLERLLDDAGDVAAPPDIAARTLAGVRASAEREAAQLDRALDRAEELDPVRAPNDLARRVLAGLAREREHAAPAREPELAAARTPRLVTSQAAEPSVHDYTRRAAPLPRRRLVWALAASLVFALAVWGAFFALHGERPRGPIAQPRSEPVENRAASQTAEQPSAEMLAALDVLEQWDLLMQNDVDVLLSTFAPADQALLDLRALDEAPPATDDANGDGTHSGPKAGPKSNTTPTEGRRG